jgi:hypothetical protein
LVRADFVSFRVWMGQLDLAWALRNGLIALEGLAERCRAFPSWPTLSVYTQQSTPPTAQT